MLRAALQPVATPAARRLSSTVSPSAFPLRAATPAIFTRSSSSKRKQRKQYPKWNKVPEGLSEEEIEKLKRSEEKKEWNPPPRDQNIVDFALERQRIAEEGAALRENYPDFVHSTFKEIEEREDGPGELFFANTKGETIKVVDYFASGTSVLFGGPGLSEVAPLNETSRLLVQDFLEKHDQLKGAGVDRIAFMTFLNTHPRCAVLDLGRFKEYMKVEDKIDLFLDTKGGALTFYAGLAIDLSKVRLWRFITKEGREFRCRPFSFIIKDGTIVKRNVSEEPNMMDTVNASVVLGQLK